MVWIILISLCLLMPSMKAQTAKDALRVVGTWSLELSSEKNGGGEKKKAKYQFLVENDSLVMMIADELGNMEERNSYPLVPKQSGPQGGKSTQSDHLFPRQSDHSKLHANEGSTAI